MKREYKILKTDPYLQPFKNDIDLRMDNFKEMKNRLLKKGEDLSSFANGHLYFGFQKQNGGWFYREWAPNAKEISLIGDFNGWDRQSHKLEPVSPGIWEIFVPGEDSIPHESKIKIEITAKDGGKFDRIPLYSKRLVQDFSNNQFHGQFWNPAAKFKWTQTDFKAPKKAPLLIYEAHVGMAGIKEGVSTFNEFTENVLPRVSALGYNAIQLMAIAEHPYYGSFGYQVSNFFAVSSRFGTPEDLKRLIDTAHGMDIAVLLDIVHSHAARNEIEGIAAFDGTEFQFFHSGEKGEHPAWGTKLFDYGKPEVIHFLLSNVKFWMDEYHFDGFRFDGVTSMLYHDHGLGAAFTSYDKYFSYNTDTQAVTYLQLAAELAKEVNPDCILIAEDMSGMPGMCIPIKDGGLGFDYRLSMGMPDFWVRTLRDRRDEDWDIGHLWHELNQRRPNEKVIGYCESHDQAMVGDKTIIFWLADKEMYWSMGVNSPSHIIDRAVALHKMIRLVTCTCAGEGYLNFMGNEFGHPEWIDFPREGNGWSYHYARRRWDLADNPDLRYQFLQSFDSAMIHLVNDQKLTLKDSELMFHHEDRKILAYKKGKYIFAFNFHPTESFTADIPVEKMSGVRIIFHTEEARFGGLRPDAVSIDTKIIAGRETPCLAISLAARTAVVCKL